MLGAFDTLLDRDAPAWVRKLETAVLMDAFARAFDVEAPSLGAFGAHEALAAFQEFTAACMDEALADRGTACAYRARLRSEALKLGSLVRALAPVRGANAFRLVRFLYRGIDIELEGEVPGDVRFGPCSFARRYSPDDCWFMSAFDEGFISGVMGENGALEFTCRLTEGATCCCARYR